MEERELLVVKYGSSSIVEGRADAETNARDNIAWYADQLSKLYQSHDLIVVTSGAVALGKTMYPDLVDRPNEEVDQFFAMSGNPFLMAVWINAFRRQNIRAGELLLTHREIEDDSDAESPGSELKRALKRMRALGGISIVNENDALSRRELAELQYGGDNDGLAAHIAVRMGASGLYLMSSSCVRDSFGAAVRRVPDNETSRERVRAYAGDSNEVGRGGMRTKVEAAILAAQAGIDAYIAAARHVSLRSIHAGRSRTHFVPRQEPATLEAARA